jgi:aerobic carbon-monoxide dehydrogenase large subunit
MPEAATKEGRYFGKAVRRKEDARFIAGEGRYVDGMTLPGMVWMSVVRSPMGHARIGRVSLDAAQKAPGVVAAFSGEDLAGEFAGPLPMAWPVTEDIRNPPHWPVARDRVRYAGEAVAVVLAESRAAARDGAELVEVDYDPLPVVTEVEAALEDGAPIVHEEFGTNHCYTWKLANGEVEEAFDGAPIVVRERYRQQRLIPNAIEPRSILVRPEPMMGEFTMWTATQVPHIVKATLGGTVGVDESKLRIVAPDVGGGFGSKLNVYAEEALCVVLARRLRRPVKWTEERSENYLATIHGRDMVQEIELAAEADGKLRGIRVHLTANMGAYLQLLTPGIPVLGAFNYCGCYASDAYSIEIDGVFTNTVPTDAYRGAGRPEANYAIERAMDALARKLDMDPAELRRRNFLPKGEMVPSAAGLQYDSVDYEPALDRALELLDYEAMRREQEARRDRGDGKQLGIGFSTYVEICGLAPSRIAGPVLRLGAGLWDAATVRILASGKVEVVTGVTGHGQGHETSWAQLAAEALGVTPDDVTVIKGDTQAVPFGMDTYGSRSLAVGGVAIHGACGRVVDKARDIAAHMLEVSAEDLEFEAGTFQVRGAPDRSVTIQSTATQAWLAHDLPDGMEPLLEAHYAYDPANFTFPFGTHLCAVEVDTETGKVDFVKYVAVDDCGNVVNPQIVDGQVHGGIAQGLAQALHEEAIYDETGTLLTASMMNYLVPSAVEIPHFTLDRTVTPSTTNPIGVKGIGEAGTIASPPAIINAVVDALSHLGVRDVPMPASPERVWRALAEAKGGAEA